MLIRVKTDGWLEPWCWWFAEIDRRGFVVYFHKEQQGYALGTDEEDPQIVSPWWNSLRDLVGAVGASWLGFGPEPPAPFVERMGKPERR